MSRPSVPSVSSLARAAGPNTAKGALPTACRRSAPPARVAFLAPNMQEAVFPCGIRGKGTGHPQAVRFSNSPPQSNKRPSLIKTQHTLGFNEKIIVYLH